jgi:hypothetical protein
MCTPVMFDSGVASLTNPKVAKKEASSVSVTPSLEPRNPNGTKSGR